MTYKYDSKVWQNFHLQYSPLLQKLMQRLHTTIKNGNYIRQYPKFLHGKTFSFPE